MNQQITESNDGSVEAEGFYLLCQDYTLGIRILLAGLVSSWSAVLSGDPYIAIVLAVWPTYEGCLHIHRGANRERGIFCPWCKDYIWGIRILLAGLVSSWSAVLSGHPYIAIVLAVCPIYWGWPCIRRGANRERGIEVELVAVDSLRSALEPEGYKICSGDYAVWIGNIDCVVRPPWTQARFVVEIKSFPGIVKRSYGLTEFLMKVNKNKKVNKNFILFRPVKQVRNQCRYLDKKYKKWHFPVLWMPESDRGDYLFYHELFHHDILVVNGGVDLLERTLYKFDKIVKLPATVRFPRPPPKDYLDPVKSLGFKFNGETKQWYGQRIDKQLAKNLALRLRPANGVVKLGGVEVT